jgi:hypothetical protein
MPRELRKEIGFRVEQPWSISGKSEVNALDSGLLTQSLLCSAAGSK